MTFVFMQTGYIYIYIYKEKTKEKILKRELHDDILNIFYWTYYQLLNNHGLLKKKMKLK